MNFYSSTIYAAFYLQIETGVKIYGIYIKYTLGFRHLFDQIQVSLFANINYKTGHFDK